MPKIVISSQLPPNTHPPRLTDHKIVNEHTYATNYDIILSSIKVLHFFIIFVLTLLAMTTICSGSVLEGPLIVTISLYIFFNWRSICYPGGIPCSIWARIWSRRSSWTGRCHLFPNSSVAPTVVFWTKV
jgi:hypothetical protein